MALPGLLSSPSPPSPEPGTVLFETERLIIRRYKLEDAEELAKAGNYLEVSKVMRNRFPSPYTTDAAVAWLSSPINCPPEYPTRQGVFLKAQYDTASEAEEGEGRLVGSLGIEPEGDVNYRMWTLGYFFTPPAWGKGYATEAVSAFVRWMFQTWPELNRIEASAFAHNEESRKVLVKSGFTLEGMRRESGEKFGVLRDEALYGFIRSDMEKETRQ
jgi:ribosomal-protein-alanine N-acetyltransferase